MGRSQVREKLGLHCLELDLSGPSAVELGRSELRLTHDYIVRFFGVGRFGNTCCFEGRSATVFWQLNELAFV